MVGGDCSDGDNGDDDDGDSNSAAGVGNDGDA